MDAPSAPFPELRAGSLREHAQVVSHTVDLFAEADAVRALFAEERFELRFQLQEALGQFDLAIAWRGRGLLLPRDILAQLGDRGGDLARVLGRELDDLPVHLDRAVLDGGSDGAIRLGRDAGQL